MAKCKIPDLPKPKPDPDAMMKVFDVIEAEAAEYEARTGNQLRAIYLRERLLPKLLAAFAAEEIQTEVPING